MGESHRHRFSGSSCSIVMGSVADLHPGEGGDQALVIEYRLESSLRDLWLVGGVGRVEFTPPQEHVHRGRRVMVIGSSAQEAGHLAHAVVLGRQILQLCERL